MLLEWDNTRNDINVNGRNMKHFGYLLSMTFLMKFLLSVWVVNAKPDFFSTSANVTGSSLTEFGSHSSHNSFLKRKIFHTTVLSRYFVSPVITGKVQKR